MYLKCGY